MSEKKRLHPVTIISNALKFLREWLVPLLLLIIFGKRGEEATSWDFFFSTILPLLILVFTIVEGVFSWWRFSYRLEEGELRIEQGVFLRKKRYIPFERIQSISISQGIVQRIFGLVKLNVETAGGGLGEAEAELTAITREEAKRIENIINLTKKGILEENEASSSGLTAEEQVQEEEKKPNIIFSMDLREVFLVALTNGGTIGVILGALAFFSEFDELFSLSQFYDEARALFTQGILFIALFVVFIILLAYVIAIIQSVLKFSNFRVEIDGEHLIVSHGVLERKKTSIPIKRIQGITIQENFIRSIFGYSTVYIINAGGTSVEGVDGRIVLLPFIKKERISRIIKKVLPDYELDVLFTPVPERAKLYYCLRSVFSFKIFALIALALYFFYPWGLLSLLLIPAAVVLAIAQYKFAGWNLSGKQLALRSRFLTKRTVYMFHHRIQTLEVSRSWWQRRRNLASVSGTVMSGFIGETGRTVDMDEEDAKQIYHWFSRTKRDRDADSEEVSKRVAPF